jgi:peroxiredoxin family protein
MPAHRPLEDDGSLTETILDLQRRLEQLEESQAKFADPNRLNLVVFGGHRDRLLAAFVIATGAAACGMEVSMFFTFWATGALRKGSPQMRGKTFVEWAFGWMLPASLRKTKLSQFEMAGLGRFLLEQEMKRKNICDLPQLVDTAAELGVHISVCEMSMNLMGIRREELMEYPGLEYCGVAKFTENAATANTTLFI